MDWNWIDPASDDQKIRNLTYIKEPNESYQYRLNWRWPREIKNVYVDTRIAGEEVPLEEIDLDVKYIYTVAQYQRFQGYRNKRNMRNGESHLVRLFPVIITETHEKLIIRQDDDDNYVQIQSPKAKAQVIIKEKKSLFKRTKDIEITIYSPDVDIRKEALCYIRKIGSKPVNHQDGYYNEFIDDIKRGVKSTFTINGIPKDNYINVFLTESTTYGELIELVKD